jgi:hypothetical protein
MFQNDLPTVSPFGERRIKLKAEILFNESKNVYFSDFYCMYAASAHYVSLVVTTPGSDADAFCRQYIVPLDK